MISEFSRCIFENNQISNFMDMSAVRTELFHAEGRKDGRTDGYDEVNNRFSQFCKLALKIAAKALSFLLEWVRYEYRPL